MLLHFIQRYHATLMHNVTYECNPNVTEVIKNMLKKLRKLLLAKGEKKNNKYNDDFFISSRKRLIALSIDTCGDNYFRIFKLNLNYIIFFSNST